MRIIGSVCLSAIVACAGGSDVEIVDVVGQNDLGLTRVEVRHATTAEGSSVELRGYDVNDAEVAHLFIHKGMQDFSYDLSDALGGATERTPARNISLGIVSPPTDTAAPPTSTVETVAPGTASYDLYVPSRMNPFTRLAVVQREAALANIVLDVQGDTETAYKHEFEGHSCLDYPTVWSPSVAGGIIPGSTCGLDVLPGATFPTRAFLCILNSRLTVSLFSAEACANNVEGTDHACGTGSPNGQCIFGPCTKANSTLIAFHDPPPGNPNCSVGYKNKGADWEYFLNGEKFCSDEGCSKGNGINPPQGCTATSCCYDPTTGKGCAYVGACPLHPSCP